MLAKTHRTLRPWRCAAALLCFACSGPNVDVDATGGSSADAGTGGDSSATGGESSAATGGTATGGASAAGGASSGGSSAAGGTSSGGTSAAGGAGTGGAGGTGGANGAGGGPPTFQPCPLTGPCAILPLGDSITEGFGSSGGGYRVELFRLAGQAGKDITFVGSLQNGPANKPTFPKHHEGHGGFAIDSGTGHAGISGGITQSAITNYHPHIVLLMIGTNDVNGNIDVNNAPARLGNLVDDITTRAPDALLVLATIMPIDSGANAKAVTYNTSVKALAADRAAKGKHVVLVDNYAVISTIANWQDTLLNDNDYLHPNDAGYALLGASFYGAVATYLR